MPAPILIADDDPDILAGLKERLEWCGHQTITAKDGAQALLAIKQERPSLVLLDLQLPIMTGIEVLEHLKNGGSGPGPDTRTPLGSQTITPSVIMLTAFGTITRAVEAMKLGATDFLTKPFDLNHLECLIRNVLEQQSLAKEVTQLRSQIESRYTTVVAESQKMKDVLAFAHRVAPSDAAVLVLGETGTGKELLARAIHRRSGRANRCFMAVNCAALPEHLLENELFGHERGAFSGANQMQEGKIEVADGGTVFLDEIGDMPLVLQSRILRLLQDKEFHRVGGTRQIRVDVRFIAATNKDLAQAVRQGTFREDLYYRLNVLPVTLPPLRERQDDILPLAEHVIAREGGRYGSEKKRLTSQAQEALCHYHWPGNIRELENVLARAVILSDREDIQTELLGLPAGGPVMSRPRQSEDTEPLSYRPPTLLETFAETTSIITLPILNSSPLQVNTRGSGGLRPEQIISYELEYQGWYLHHRARVRAGIFYNHLSDLIKTRAVAPLQGGTSDIYGGEAGIEILATTWLSGFGNMAYQEIGQTFTEITRRAAPRFKYNAGLRAQWKNGLSGEIAYHWVGAVTNPLSQRFVDFQPFGVIPPDAYVGSYQLLNLRGAYRLWQEATSAGYRREAEIAVSVFNALNDTHREHPLGDLIGSRIMGWMTVRY